MNLDELIRSAVLPIVPVCEPGLYTGTAQEYCEYRYTERGGAFGDDGPDLLLFELTMDWYLPLGVNPNSRKRQLRQALVDIGFTAPRIVNASDEEYQHFVFECEIEGAL